ncbi:short chain dehydrogenase [Sphingomonas spermidinifaciens]|uniref:Short chain dehydrogenase n=1 Tax=Sphingomonas spermidinifaciens TaxID=1141889 RepID=A0A2A4B893_9SPHN|nr:SDR family oxidoreductase [Sphingomonas spermidinifaciens]PCD04307.1 short chain dehydrogenase [Sphingomonas spermidinifaciens]
MARWTTADMPDLAGRVAVVTGTGGIGLEDALALARAGATTIVAGRNPAKGAQAVDRILRAAGGAKVGFELLDLADLGSVAAGAERLAQRLGRIDILINNAAVMVPPARQVTADGFELQFATNYLGHFALTGHLLPLLRATPGARVVSLSSVAAPRGAIRLDDLQFERGYQPMPAYAQSKLACLMFALEFQRRSDAMAWGVTSIAAHPGVSRTDLIHNGAGRRSLPGMVRSVLPFLFQPAAQGALPTLFAATAPGARGGAYYGPDGMGGLRGYPTLSAVPPRALDEEIAARLWEASERLCGVRFGAAAAQPETSAAA